MKYLLLICVDEGARLTQEEQAAMNRGGTTWAAEMDRRGVREQGHALRPTGEARTVRLRGSKLSVTDGPFAETKERVAGFDILECASLEEAIEVASKHPVVRIGSVEVRQFLGD